MNWFWSRPSREGREVLGINRRNMDHVFADYRPGKFRDLDDKLRCKDRLTAQDIPVPRTLVIVSSAADLGRLDEVLHDRDELVIKPARGSRGRGILVLKRGPEGWQTPGGRLFDEHAIHEHVHEGLAGHFSLDEGEDRVLVETRIHASRWIRGLYPGGLSDIRVVVENGEPLQAMLRVPTAKSDGRANLHEGGIGIGVDLENGRTVHAVQDGRVVSRHPDTGEELIGHEVPNFQRCLEISRAVARAFPEIRYLGVDLVIDSERGVLVLEVNARPGLAIQVANQRGQGVSRRRRQTTFEIVTERVAWATLALLGIAPFWYGAWRGTTDPVVQPVRIERTADTSSDQGGITGDSSGVEWSDSSEPVSALDDRFARALTAAAEGDTTRALTLYEEAASDPSVRPFALNNIALIHKARNDIDQATAVLELAVESYPSYARGHYNLGLIQRDAGDRAAARASFLRAVELRPSHARSWSRLGELYLQEEDWELAVDALENAIRFDPNAVAERRRLGVALLALDRAGAAAHRYEEALALSPRSLDSEEGYLRARLAQIARSGVAPSNATLDSLDDRYAVAIRRRGAAARFVAIGAEISWWFGDPRAGLNRIASVPEQDLPLDAASLRTLLHLETGNFDAVLSRDPAPGQTRLHDLARWSRYLDRLGRISEETPPPMSARLDPVVRILASLARGSDPDAELIRVALTNARDSTERGWINSIASDNDALFEPTLARMPRTGDSPVPPLPTPVLVWSLMKLDADTAAAHAEFLSIFVPYLRDRFAFEVDIGSARKAHELGLQLLHIAPKDADVLTSLVGLELRLDNPGLARTLFEQIPGPALRRPDVRLMEARLLLREGEYRAARRGAEQLLRQNPANVEALEVLAAVQIAEKNVHDAIGTLRKALQLSPGRQDLRERLARALMSRREYVEAEAEWTQLVGLDTDARLRRSTLFNLALCIQRQGRNEDAIAVWAQLLIEFPDDARAHYNLGLAFERSDRLGEAIGQYRRALELDPDHEPSRDRLQRLDPGMPGDS